MMASTGLRNLVPGGSPSRVLGTAHPLSQSISMQSLQPTPGSLPPSGQKGCNSPTISGWPNSKSIEGTRGAESGSLAGLQHPLLTEKETEFAGCARDLPRFLLSASCLDVPQQPDLSFRSLPQCLSGCPLTACPGKSLQHCPASRPTMKAGPLKQEEPSSCVAPSLDTSLLHGYSL